jgi:hypothetical protein
MAVLSHLLSVVREAGLQGYPLGDTLSYDYPNWVTAACLLFYTVQNVVDGTGLLVGGDHFVQAKV